MATVTCTSTVTAHDATSRLSDPQATSTVDLAPLPAFALIDDGGEYFTDGRVHIVAKY